MPRTMSAPTAATYSVLATVPAGNGSYVHLGGGAPDGASHFYAVVALDSDNLTAGAADQAAEFSRYLLAGPNLISVPVEAQDWSVGSVFQTVVWTRARTYDNPAGQGKNWRSGSPTKPWSDLGTVDRTSAVWVAVAADGWWSVAGLVPASTPVTLTVGWNFIGYPSFSTQTVDTVLAGVNYQTVEGFAVDPPFNLRRLSGGDTLTAGEGYWVHVAGSDALVNFTN